MSHSPSSVDCRGRRITRVDIQRSMRVNIAAGCLGLMWMAMSVSMPLTMFMEAIGTGGFLIGLMMTIRFVAMLAQIPSAFVAQRLPSRRPMWTWLALVHRCLWFGVAGLAFWWQPDQWWLPLTVIVIVGLSDILGNGATVLWMSWMTDLIPSKSAGSFWGRRQAIITASALVGVIDIFIHQRVSEPKPIPTERGLGGWRLLLSPLRDRDFRHLTLGMGCWSFGANMLATFTIIHFKRDFPVTYLQVALLTISGALGAIASSHLLGILTDRLGPRVLAAVLMVLAPLTMASWFFVHAGYTTLSLPWGSWTLPQVLVNQTIATFIGGGLIAGIVPCQLRLAGLLSRASGRTMAMAVHWSIVGIIAALGTLLGGIIMEWCTRHHLAWVLPNGTLFSYLQIMVILFAVTTWTIALPLILSIRTPVDYVPFSEALSRLFLTNPVNAFRNIYSLQTVSTFRPAHERARAARKLGKGRSEIAIPELTARMEDPSLEVQEEAIHALGEINTTESIAALLEKLGDPACESVPQIARALRHSRDPRCVEPLIARLQSGDRETLVECIRTLGHLGDRRAIPPLLNLLAHHQERKVLAVSSEALASLGELSAAYQIIPQMRAMPNRMLKRALAVAIGDLLGRRDTFYQYLIADTESAGSGASQILMELRKVLGKRYRTLSPTLDAIENSYLDGEIPRCAEMLLHLGLHVAQFIHRLPLTLDPDRAFEQLLERDHQTALGIWYLKVCNEAWSESGRDTRDPSDLLLGLHIILGFTLRAGEPPEVGT